MGGACPQAPAGEALVPLCARGQLRSPPVTACQICEQEQSTRKQRGQAGRAQRWARWPRRGGAPGSPSRTVRRHLCSRLGRRRRNSEYLPPLESRAVLGCPRGPCAGGSPRPRSRGSASGLPLSWNVLSLWFLASVCHTSAVLLFTGWMEHSRNTEAGALDGWFRVHREVSRTPPAGPGPPGQRRAAPALCSRGRARLTSYRVRAHGRAVRKASARAA